MKKEKEGGKRGRGDIQIRSRFESFRRKKRVCFREGKKTSFLLTDPTDGSKA